MRKSWFTQRVPAALLAIVLLVQVVSPGLVGATIPEKQASPADVGEFIPGEIIVQYNAPMSMMGLRSTGPTTPQSEVVVVPEDKSVEDVIAEYKDNPDVLYAEPNYIVRAASLGSDWRIDEQWALPMIKAPEVWAEHGAALSQANPIVVAVLDTGVDTEHEDLAGVLLQGRNFARYRDDYSYYTDPLDYSDDHYDGHGTHVTGIIAAVHDNNMGVSGVVGPCATNILPVKVLNDYAWGTVFDVAEGIKWAADNGVRVINLSLTVEYYSHTLATAVRYAQDKGVLVVAAMGDSYESYPAALAGVIGVGSVDEDKESVWWDYAASEHIDLVAPGYNVLSTLPGNSYDYMSGTSMAAAHVSAAAAVYLLVHPAATPADVAEALYSSAEDLTPGGGDVGWDSVTGHGLLDMQTLVNFANGSTPLVSFVAPVAGAKVTGTTRLEVEVANPSSVIAVAFFKDEVAENTLIGTVERTKFNQNYYSFEWYTTVVSDGECVIYAQAFNNAGPVGEATAITLNICNDPTTGLLLRVVAPNGAIPGETYVTVLRKLGSGDPDAWLDYEYDLVWDSYTDPAGMVRLPGTVAIDNHDYVVIVQGEFDIDNEWVNFVYVRELEGPEGMVIDGASSVLTEFAMVDLDNNPLLYPHFILRIKDSTDVNVMSIPLPVKAEQNTFKLYLDQRVYDAYAFWSSYTAYENSDGELDIEGPDYFLAKEELQIDHNTATVLFDTTEAALLRGKAYNSSAPVTIHLWSDELDEVLNYPVDIDDYEVVVSAGHYNLSARLNVDSSWYYSFEREGGITVEASETPVDVMVGGEFTLKGELQASELVEGESLSLDFWAEDSYGNLITSLRQKQYSYYEYWQDVIVYMLTYDSNGNNQVNHGAVEYWRGDLSFPINREPGDYQVRLCASPGPLFGGGAKYTEYLPFVLLDAAPVTTKEVQVYGPSGTPVGSNFYAYLYSYKEQWSEFNWWFSNYFRTDSQGKLRIPSDVELSPRGNVIAIGCTIGSDTYAYAKHITSLDELDEIRFSDCSVEITVDTTDHAGSDINLYQHINLFVEGDQGQMYETASWSFEDAVFVVPGFYSFEAHGQVESGYYGLTSDIAFYDSASKVELGGSTTASLTIEAADGYHLDVLSLWGEGGQYLDWWFDNEPQTEVTAYVSPGAYDAYAFVSQPDPEKFGDYIKMWTYGLDLGQGGLQNVEEGQSYTYTVGGPFSFDFTLCEQELTPFDYIEGETYFADAQGNRVEMVAIYEVWDGGVIPTVYSALERGELYVNAQGRLTVREPEVQAQYDYEPYVYPFVRIYKVDDAAQTEARVFNRYDDDYYYGFCESVEDLGLGRYRVELAISMGPEGPRTTGTDEKYYVTIVAEGLPATLDEEIDGKYFGSRTVQITGMASANNEVEVFVYQGEIGQTPSATVTADEYGNFTANVTVSNDGVFYVAARNLGGTLSEAVTIYVDTLSPTKPTLVAEVGSDGASVVLSWIGEAGTTATIYRNGTVLTDISGSTTYTDRTVQRGSTYTYEVALTDAAENSSEKSTAVEVTIPAGLSSASASWQRGMNYLAKLSGGIAISAVGTAGMNGKAEVHLGLANGGTEVEVIDLAGVGQNYSGLFVIPDGTASVNKIDVWLEDTNGLTPKLDALRDNPIGVGGSVTGIINRTNVGNVAGINVSIRPVGTSWSIASSDTNSSGAFRLDGFATGDYYLSVYDALSGQRHELRVSIVGGVITGPETITLSERHSLDVSVVSSVDSTKLENVLVVINAGGFTRSARSDDLGRVSFIGLPPGVYTWSTLHAQELVPAFANSTGTLNIPAQGGEYTISLLPMSQMVGSLSGVVTDQSTGQPVAGASVSAYSFANRNNSGQGTATTAADGSYTVSNLMFGSDYRVSIEHPDYKAISLADQTIVALQETVLNSALIKAAKVSGKVYGRIGNEAMVLEDISVYANRSTWSPSVAVTQADGSYVLRDVPTGTISISASAHNLGFGSAVEQVTIGVGEIKTVDIYLDELSSIDGHVTDSSGSPLQYVYIMVANRSTRTDSAGYYLISGIEAGSYSARADKGGYISQAEQCEVIAGQRATCNFTLNTPSEMSSAFSGSSNRFSVSAVEATPGAVLTYVANYYNRFNTDVGSVQIIVDIPEGTSIVSGSLMVNGASSAVVPQDGKLTLNICNVAGNSGGTVMYQLRVNDDIAAEIDLLATALIKWTTDGTESQASLGVCRTSVLFTTISAPAYTTDGYITVYGKSVPGAIVHVYDGDQLLGTTAVDGRWWHLSVRLTAPAMGVQEEEHRLYAVAVKNGLYSNMAAPALVVYRPSAVIIEDIYMNGGWVYQARPNPYIGLITFGITEKQPFSMYVKFDGDVSNVSATWQGEVYLATTRRWRATG